MENCQTHIRLTLLRKYFNQATTCAGPREQYPLLNIHGAQRLNIIRCCAGVHILNFSNQSHLMSWRLGLSCPTLIAKLRSIIRLLLRLVQNPRAQRWIQTSWKMLQWIHSLLRKRHTNTPQNGSYFTAENIQKHYTFASSDVPRRIDSSSACYTPESSAIKPSSNVAIPQYSGAPQRMTESLIFTEEKTDMEDTRYLSGPSREDTNITVVSPTESSSGNTSTAETQRETITSYNQTLHPGNPKDIKRYDRSIKIPKRSSVKDEVSVKPWTFFESHPRDDGWIRCVHPEGVSYFYHADMRLFTEANLDDRETRERLELCFSILAKRIGGNDVHPRQRDRIKQSDLVLEFWPDDLELCLYYYAHHETQTIFWLDEVDLHVELQEVASEIPPTHMKHAIESFYWYILFEMHLGYFPYGRREISPNIAVKELERRLAWLLTDELTSVRSPSPFDAMQLKQLTSVVVNIKDLDDEYTLAIAGRLLSDLSWSRFLNHHGEYGARLNSNQSVYGDDNPSRGPLMSLFYLLFFNAPVGHLKSIHNAYTDELIKLDTWKKHLDDLVDNWREYILYSTVLLNANVAFLDISNVTPDDFSQVSTVGQVASFISTITSIGSIIVGLLLVRQHRPSSEMDAADAMESLERYIKRTGSVQKLALLYAVPYAFLMWGMISFLVAIAWECFSGGSRVTIVMCAVAFFLIVCLALWCAYSGTRSLELSRTVLSSSWEHIAKPMESLRSRAMFRLPRRRQLQGNDSPSTAGHNARGLEA